MPRRSFCLDGQLTPPTSWPSTGSSSPCSCPPSLRRKSKRRHSRFRHASFGCANRSTPRGLPRVAICNASPATWSRRSSPSSTTRRVWARRKPTAVCAAWSGGVPLLLRGMLQEFLRDALRVDASGHEVEPPVSQHADDLRREGFIEQLDRRRSIDPIGLRDGPLFHVLARACAASISQVPHAGVLVVRPGLPNHGARRAMGRRAADDARGS